MRRAMSEIRRSAGGYPPKIPSLGPRTVRPLPGQGEGQTLRGRDPRPLPDQGEAARVFARGEGTAIWLFASWLMLSGFAARNPAGVINQVPSTGQSLSLGFSSIPLEDSTAAYPLTAKMFAATVPTETASFVGETTDSGSQTISVPSGVQNGDLLFAFLSYCGSSLEILQPFCGGATAGETAPAGWTLLNTTAFFGYGTLTIWYRYAASEPSSYTWTASGSPSPTPAGGMVAYRNVLLSDGSASNPSGTTQNPATGSFANAVANDWQVSFFGWASISALTMGDWTSRVNVTCNTFPGGAAGDKVLGAAGTVAADSSASTAAASDYYWGTYTVTLYPYELNLAPSNLGIRLVPDNSGTFYSLSASNLTGLQGLTETEATVSPNGTQDGETIYSGMANGLNDIAPYNFLGSAHGVSGQPYTALEKGTTPYANLLTAVTGGLAHAGGLGRIVRAVPVLHGESDDKAGTSQSTYENDLVTWQQNLQADIQAITGQTEGVPFIIDQISNWTRFVPRATSVIPQAELNAALHNPYSILLVGPKYWLASTDGTHITAASEEYEGEMFAKVYEQAIVKGNPWMPVYPTSITLSGQTISATFNVPIGPLTFDTSLVTDPATGTGCSATSNLCRGFEYTDNSSPPTINATPTISGNVVSIHLSAAPTATAGNRILSYAYTGISGNNAGPTTGARGNLRDSDPAVSRLDGTHLYNWCVHFSESF